MEKEVIEVVTQSKRALGELKPAFRACPQAYTELCKAVNEGRVSLYRLKSADCSLVIAGERDGDNYFLWGVAVCVRASNNWLMSSKLRGCNLYRLIRRFKAWRVWCVRLASPPSKMVTLSA